MTLPHSSSRQNSPPHENSEEREHNNLKFSTMTATRLASSISNRIYTSLPNPLNLSSLLLARLESLPRRVIQGMVQAVPGSSATVQRVLQEDQSTLDLEEYKTKYAKELKADAELQALQREIRAVKQQIQQARSQRLLTHKKQCAQRERDHKHLEAQLLKYKQVLDSFKHRKDAYYTRALVKASNNGRSSNSTYFPKLLLLPRSTGGTASAGSAGTSSTTNGIRSAEKDAQHMEVTIVRHLHQTMVYQNQCDLAQHWAREIETSLKRQRALLDQEQAETAMYQMILEGTQRALMGLYPEIVLRQEALVELLQQSERRPPLLVPRLLLRQGHGYYNCSSCGTTTVSDLGESLIADSVTTDTDSLFEQQQQQQKHHRKQQHRYNFGMTRGPVFTSVQALQQYTLQQRAGVESY